MGARRFLVPLCRSISISERPLDGDETETSLPYSALALSLVPIALGIASQWPDDGEERVSAIRLRSAPLSPELYALTGTDSTAEWKT